MNQSSELLLRQVNLRKLKIELARRHIIDYATYIKSDYIINWHHALLGSYLDRFIAGEIKRLMVFMPPQHGKTQLVSRFLPTFLLGKNKNNKVIVGSYSSDLSDSFNRDCQNIMEGEAYQEIFPNTYLTKSYSKIWLRNSHVFQPVDSDGFFRAAGVGGPLTGHPADFAIIDDPVKDRMEASSPAYQVRNWNWYNDVLFTRIHNNTGILLTQTRWDENDLSGLLIKSMEAGRGEKWVIIKMPGIKEDNLNPEDPREIGEALWPGRHSLERLQMIQKSNLRTFQSLYQQNPKPTETGGEFYKQFKIWRNVKDFPYRPDLPIHLTFDFNVNPGMHAGVWQMEGKKAWKIAEIITISPRNTTRGTCQEFMRLYQNHPGGLFIYGDPSGFNRDTRSEEGHNDYYIIEQELRKYHPSLRVAVSHPSVKMRGNFINSVFESNIYGLEFWIGSKCVKSIEDFMFIKEDSDGTKLKEKTKDIGTGVTYEKWGHLSDADDYFFCEAFNKEYIQYQQGENQLDPSDIIISRRTPKYTL
jgi:hypothetical protein